VPTGFPEADAIVALRAWYAGLAVREAVARYLPTRLGEGRSARGVLGRIRRQLIAERNLPVTPSRWQPETPLIATLDGEGAAGISAVRLCGVLRRFFHDAAKAIDGDHPMFTDKLRRACPHWMRHTHATSIYLHSDEVKRARQIAEAFGDSK
jgi:hypothetical protein